MEITGKVKWASKSIYSKGIKAYVVENPSFTIDVRVM
jgi:hypothetical protein